MPPRQKEWCASCRQDLPPHGHPEEEALDKMSVKTEGRSRQLCHTPLTSGILARIRRVRSSKADIFYVRYKYQGEKVHEPVLQVLDVGGCRER